MPKKNQGKSSDKLKKLKKFVTRKDESPDVRKTVPRTNPPEETKLEPEPDTRLMAQGSGESANYEDRHGIPAYLLPMDMASGKRCLLNSFFPEGTNNLTCWLGCFETEKNPIVKSELFWAIANTLWNGPEQLEPLLDRHEWSEKMILEACRNRFLSVGGSGSSGKSHVFAAWGVVNWLCAPDRTMVLMTSTTVREARKRIWGSVVRLVLAVKGVPLKLRDSVASANYINEEGKVIDTAGLSLVAAERSKTKEATAKIIGIKAKRLLLIADELGAIADSLLKEALSNLTHNPKNQIIGLSNPGSTYNAFGQWSEPMGGWGKVDINNDIEWETKYRGKYIRFNALDSPNLSLPEDEQFEYLPTRERIDEAIMNLGERSSLFRQMWLAVFYDSDSSDTVYTETEIRMSGGTIDSPLKQVVARIAGFDPGFTNGGDRSILRFAEVGYDDRNNFVIRFGDKVHIKEDMTDKSTPRSFQIAKSIVKECQKRGVESVDFGMDATGAGAPLSDIIAQEFGEDILRVNFSGSATDKRASVSNPKTGKDLYANRVSELWFVGKELLRTRQIRNIPPEMAMEMTSRGYLIKGQSTGARLAVEPKEQYRSRVGQSPDEADAGFVVLDVARSRHRLVAVEPIPENTALPIYDKIFRPEPLTGPGLRRSGTTVKSLDMVGSNPNAFLPD